MPEYAENMEWAEFVGGKPLGKEGKKNKTISMFSSREEIKRGSVYLIVNFNIKDRSLSSFPSPYLLFFSFSLMFSSHNTYLLHIPFLST